MRLPDPLIPNWLGYCISVPILIVASPVIAACFAWAGVVWLKRQAIGPTREWQRWFAWYPVRVETNANPFGEHRWLEIVERRSFAIMQNTSFRTLTDAWVNSDNSPSR